MSAMGRAGRQLWVESGHSENYSRHMQRCLVSLSFLSLAGCIAATPAAPAGGEPNLSQTPPRCVAISGPEAQRRGALQVKASQLEAQLSANPAFSGLRINQDSRCFRVLVTFKGRKPSPSELTSDPELQAVIDVGQSSKSRGELIALQNRIFAIARARKIETMIFPTAETGKVEVHVRDVEAFRAALADANINDADVTLIKTEDFPRTQR